MNQFIKGYAYIVLAGLFWSSTGLFASLLLKTGVSSFEIAFYRLAIGSLFMGIYILIFNPEAFKITWKGLILTAGIGIICHGGFNMAFFTAVDMTGVIIATILLYLAPLILLGLSVRFFNETLTSQKIGAVVLAVLGSILAITGGIVTGLSVPIIGLLMGLLAALAYALISVFSKAVLSHFKVETVLFYSFIFGSFTVLPFLSINRLSLPLMNAKGLMLVVSIGLLSACIPYLFYVHGIATGLDLSKVGILSMVELIFSIGWSLLFLGELLNPVKAFGVALICLSIYLVNKPQINVLAT